MISVKLWSFISLVRLWWWAWGGSDGGRGFWGELCPNGAAGWLIISALGAGLGLYWVLRLTLWFVLDVPMPA